MVRKIVLSLLIVGVNLFGDVEKGRELYEINCAACHSVKMQGGLGRDFNLVSYTRKKRDIIAYITSPGDMFRKFGYSANAMPELPLSEDEILDIAQYIDSLQPFKEWMKEASKN